MITVSFVVLAIIAPWIAPWDVTAHPLLDEVRPQTNPVPGPEPGHPLGGDDRGRDLLSRLIVGSRQTLIVGVFATLFGLIGGLILGTIAGALGGGVDSLVMRIVDVMLSIPSLLLAFTDRLAGAQPQPVDADRRRSRSSRCRSSRGCCGGRCWPRGAATTSSPHARWG